MPVNVLEIDWYRVMINLRARYGPISRVAKEVGASEQHLGRLARGEVGEPKYSIGIKLLDIHFDVMGSRHKEAINGRR